MNAQKIHAFRLAGYTEGALVPHAFEGPRSHCLAGALRAEPVYLPAALVRDGAQAVLYLPPAMPFDLDEWAIPIVDAVREIVGLP